MERALREPVSRRAAHRCEYCRVPEARDTLPFEVDHIIAQSHGRFATINNLCFSCFACNHHKGTNIAGIDPATGKIVPLFNPRSQQWSRHFRWRGPVLVGRTSNGRATVRVLRINLDHRVRFRRELREERVFPPE